MRNLDFSSWQAVLSTIVGLAFIALITVGIRLLVMQTVQQRRERENRQINERLRTLIAAYKTLGGSFTGNLAVDPMHLRDLRRRAEQSGSAVDRDALADATLAETLNEATSSDRSRRIRDAVEAALSDIILLGTEDQVRLAAKAATELAAGRPVHTAELVISLRNFIREVLDLDPVPSDLIIPKQGPARPGAAQRGKGEGQEGKGGGGKGGGGAGGAAAGGGMAMGVGAISSDDHHEDMR
jgi:heme exporter protein D